MEAYLIVVAVIACLLLLLVDLYIMAIYSHKEDALSPVTVFCRVLVVLTLLLTQLQPLFLIVDVANSRSGTNDLTAFWLGLYICLMAELGVFKPIATSLYERDYDDPCWKSFLWALVEIVISIGVIGFLILLGWLAWGTITVDLTQVQLDASHFSISVSTQQAITAPASFQFSSNIVCFFIAAFCLLGYPVLALCGACGLTVMPISLILEFANRPTFRKSADAKKVSEFLKVETVRLLREHEKLSREAERAEEVQGFFERRRVNREIQAQLKDIEEQVELQRDYYQLFKMELDMKEVNPAIYWCKLILGILAGVFSVLLWFQILFSQLVYPAELGHTAVFLDQLLLILETQNANFVGIGLLMALCFYCTCCIVKGSVFFSTAVPCLVVHPMAEGRTWLNSFLFHLSLCSLSATSLLHLLARTFPFYLRGGSISLVLGSILNSVQVLGWLLAHKVFTYCFLGAAVLGLFYVTFKLLCTNPNKGELLQRIEAKRVKLFGKEGQNKALTYIEMVDLSKQRKKA